MKLSHSRDKYFNHKKPQRPDVTKVSSSSFDEPLAKLAKLNKEGSRRGRGGGGGGGGDGEDTDHIAEITQLKEKIASLQKTIGAKNNELVAKQAEMNQARISS